MARFAKRWIEAILNRDKQMSQRNPREHRRLVIRLGTQQEDGAYGWCPFRKQRETEIALLDPFTSIPSQRPATALKPIALQFRASFLGHGALENNPQDAE